MLKRVLVSAGVAVVVLGTVTGFAASLNVSGNSLASGGANNNVAACNSSANVGSWTTSFSGGQYVVSGGSLTSGSGCNGLNYSVSLTDSSGNQLGSASGKLDATGAATLSFTATGTSIPAGSVSGVSVSISG